MTKTMRFSAIFLAAMMIMSSLTIFASAKEYWVTGRFDSGYTAKGYTTVNLENTRKNGYIKVYSYDSFGNKTSGQMHITLRTSSGKWLCEFDTKSGSKLKLGNNNSAYRVYIAKKKYPNTIKGNADDFLNVGRCNFWAINCSSNCYIK